MNLYIDWHSFERLFNEDSHGRIIEQVLLNEKTHKFICNAPIGSGKSTAIRNWIVNTYNNEDNEVIGKRKYILIVPTVNIALEFYSKMMPQMNQKQIQCCVQDEAFKSFKNSIKKGISVIITTYHTAKTCLGTILEQSFHKQWNIESRYTLLIDEGHLLLEYIPIIEFCREFSNVGIISATTSDIDCLSVFKDFIRIKPDCSIKYDRDIFIHKLHNEMSEQRRIIAQQVIELSKSFDKVLIKIENIDECKLLKDEIDNQFKSALYNGKNKEVQISDEGKFVNPSEVDIVIATSCIQAGQSLKENMVSIFIQTRLDTVSSVIQFLGRNRLPHSVSHLYLRLNSSKFSFKQEGDRYKTRRNQLQSSAWFTTYATSWQKLLSSMGSIILDVEVESMIKEEAENTQSEYDIDSNIIEKDLGKEFTKKSLLYKHFNIKSLKYIPKYYEIKEHWGMNHNVKTRFYSLIRNETTNE